MADVQKGVQNSEDERRSRAPGRQVYPDYETAHSSITGHGSSLRSTTTEDGTEITVGTHVEDKHSKTNPEDDVTYPIESATGWYLEDQLSLSDTIELQNPSESVALTHQKRDTIRGILDNYTVEYEIDHNTNELVRHLSLEDIRNSLGLPDEVGKYKAYLPNRCYSSEGQESFTQNASQSHETGTRHSALRKSNSLPPVIQEATTWSPLNISSRKRPIQAPILVISPHEAYEFPSLKSISHPDLASQGLYPTENSLKFLQESSSWITTSTSTDTSQSFSPVLSSFISSVNSEPRRSKSLSPAIPSSSLFPLKMMAQPRNDTTNTLSKDNIGDIPPPPIKRKSARCPRGRSDSGISTSFDHGQVVDTIGPTLINQLEEEHNLHHRLKNDKIQKGKTKSQPQAHTSKQSNQQQIITPGSSSKLVPLSLYQDLDTIYAAELKHAARNVNPESISDVSRFLKKTRSLEQYLAKSKRYYSVRYVDGDEVKIRPGSILNQALVDAGKVPIQTYADYGRRIQGHKFMNLCERSENETLSNAISEEGSFETTEDALTEPGTDSFDPNVSCVPTDSASTYYLIPKEASGSQEESGTTTHDGIRVEQSLHSEEIPESSPNGSSFVPPFAHRMRSSLIAHKEIRATPQNARHNLGQLKYKCPRFPLKEQDLSLKFPGRERLRCQRLQKLENGEWMEEAWCFHHKRWEFSHVFELGRRPATADEIITQRRVGRLLLTLGVLLFPVGGCCVLWDMASDSRAAPYLMRAFGSLRCDWVHPDDRRMAKLLLIILGSTVSAICLAALGYGYYLVITASTA